MNTCSRKRREKKRKRESAYYVKGHKVNGHPVERSAAASLSEEEAAAICQKGKKNVRIGEGTVSDSVQFNSIPFHSKRMAFHLGYHSSPALLNYKVLHT